MKKLFKAAFVLLLLITSVIGVSAQEVSMRSIEEIVIEIRTDLGLSTEDVIDPKSVDIALLEELGDSVMEAYIGNTELHEEWDQYYGGDDSETLMLIHTNLGSDYLNGYPITMMSFMVFNRTDANDRYQSFGGMMGGYGNSGYGGMMGDYGNSGYGGMMGGYGNSGYGNSGYRGMMGGYGNSGYGNSGYGGMMGGYGNPGYSNSGYGGMMSGYRNFNTGFNGMMGNNFSSFNGDNQLLPFGSNRSYGMMNGFGTGGMIMGMLGFIILVILLVSMLTSRGRRQSFVSNNDGALSILKERYAKGEISREEFVQASNTLK